MWESLNGGCKGCLHPLPGIGHVARKNTPHKRGQVNFAEVHTGKGLDQKFNEKGSCSIKKK